MAHFAQLDENNMVINVIVVADNDCLDVDGKESESVGISFCKSIIPGRWVQTSYNHKIRKRFAGLGFKYDENLDIFIAPQPNSDYVLDDNYDWVPRV